MTATAIRLPDEQIASLQRGYAAVQKGKFWTAAAGALAVGASILISLIVAEVDIGKLASNITRFTSYFERLMHLENGLPVWTNVAEWFWGAKKWLAKIGETLVIAYLGTALGGFGAFLFCFLASRNLVNNRIVLIGARRFLEICRTVPELVFALTFVVAFGLGALPGILALAIHTLGALGKQFSEVVENIDLKPFDGVTSTGATWTEAVRFAALPQVLPSFASYGLLRFEINVRGAAIMGFVGAGGIGQDLLEAIRKFYYSDVSAMLVMIVGTVILIDYATERIRHRLIGGRRDT